MLQVGVRYAPADQPTKQTVMDKIWELGGSTGGYDIFMPNPYGNTMVAQMPSNRLYHLAELPQVRQIDPYSTPQASPNN